LGSAVVQEFLNQFGADASRIAGEQSYGGLSHVKLWVLSVIPQLIFQYIESRRIHCISDYPQIGAA